MGSDLEDVLLLMADTLKKLESNQHEFNNYIETLTDANHSLKSVHELLIPIIQDMSGVMSVMPDLINDVTLLHEEIKLYLKTTEKSWLANDQSGDKRKNEITGEKTEE